MLCPSAPTTCSGTLPVRNTGNLCPGELVGTGSKLRLEDDEVLLSAQGYPAGSGKKLKVSELS